MSISAKTAVASKSAMRLGTSRACANWRYACSNVIPLKRAFHVNARWPLKTPTFSPKSSPAPRRERRFDAFTLPLIHDGLGDLFLAPHRVRGHDFAPQV